MQFCTGRGTVVTTGVATGVVGRAVVGVIVTTGGFPGVVHPLTRTMDIRASRRIDTRPEIFRAIVPDIQRGT